MKILVSTICFINFNKPGAEIYEKYANRLIDDVIKKTPYDIRISTNAPQFFEEKIKQFPDRVYVYHDILENHYVAVHAFNQLLKFIAIKDIDSKYDYVFYLDCDAGFTHIIDEEVVSNYIQKACEDGFDMIAARTYVTYNEQEKLFLETDEERDLFSLPMFYRKLKYYGLNEEYRGACFPSEHIFIVKNDNRLTIMCKKFEEFCFEYEKQINTHAECIDYEAFEIGVSAHLAGYKIKDLDTYGHSDVLKIGFNYNNWERIKL